MTGPSIEQEPGRRHLNIDASDSRQIRMLGPRPFADERMGSRADGP